MPKPGMSGNLDLLRAVAVMSVLFHHFAETAWHNDGFETLGRFGVVLFFVHTSCVLMSSLERMTPAAGSDAFLAVAFWIRRFFRIYPLAIVCIATIVLLHIPAMPMEQYRWIGWGGVFSNFALAQNLAASPNLLGPLWSLPLEVQMYLLLPFAFLVLRGGRYRSPLLWLAALLPACLLPHLASMRPYQILVFMPCFAAGLLAYDAARSTRAGRKLPAWAWPVAIVLLLGMFGPYDPAGFSEKYFRCWGLALGVGLLYPFVQEASTNWFYAGCRWIAERSYGIYLSHCIVLWVVFNCMHGSPLWLQAPVLVGGLLGIPALLYRGVEQPLVRVGARLANSMLVRPQPVPAPAIV